MLKLLRQTSKCILTLLSLCSQIITFLYFDVFLLWGFRSQGFKLLLCSGRQRKEMLTLLESELLRSRHSPRFLLLVAANRRRQQKHKYLNLVSNGDAKSLFESIFMQIYFTQGDSFKFLKEISCFFLQCTVTHGHFCVITLS